VWGAAALEGGRPVKDPPAGTFPSCCTTEEENKTEKYREKTRCEESEMMEVFITVGIGTLVDEL